MHVSSQLLAWFRARKIFYFETMILIFFMLYFYIYNYFVTYEIMPNNDTNEFDKLITKKIMLKNAHRQMAMLNKEECLFWTNRENQNFAQHFVLSILTHTNICTFFEFLYHYYCPRNEMKKGSVWKDILNYSVWSLVTVGDFQKNEYFKWVCLYKIKVICNNHAFPENITHSMAWNRYNNM